MGQFESQMINNLIRILMPGNVLEQWNLRIKDTLGTI